MKQFLSRESSACGNFDYGALPNFYDTADQAVRDVTVELPEALRHVHRVQQRTPKELLHIANAAKALERLPEAGECIHIVAKGNFAAWDFCPAVLRLAAPATIRRLDITTLGFNNRVVNDICQLLDAAELGEVWLLFSCYFRDSCKAEAAYAIEQIGSRGGRLAAVRTHAKLQLFELSDGRCIVIETSANLRSCKNVEQFTIYSDRGLLQFHREWIERVITEASR